MEIKTEADHANANAQHRKGGASRTKTASNLAASRSVACACASSATRRSSAKTNRPNMSTASFPGAVRTMRFSSDGRRQILGFHLPGEVFGLELGDTHTLSAEALANSEIVMVRHSALNKAATDDARAARALLQLTSEQLTSAREHALVLGRKGACERVAAFLLQLADRFVAKREMDLPMSRADIADYLGLTIETVSRAFSEFERNAAIALPSSRHVVMRNPHRAV